jgi:chromosome segregation ATPase
MLGAGVYTFTMGEQSAIGLAFLAAVVLLVSAAAIWKRGWDAGYLEADEDAEKREKKAKREIGALKVNLDHWKGRATLAEATLVEADRKWAGVVDAERQRFDELAAKLNDEVSQARAEVLKLTRDLSGAADEINRRGQLIEAKDAALERIGQEYEKLAQRFREADNARISLGAEKVSFERRLQDAVGDAYDQGRAQGRKEAFEDIREALAEAEADHDGDPVGEDPDEEDEHHVIGTLKLVK